MSGRDAGGCVWGFSKVFRMWYLNPGHHISVQLISFFLILSDGFCICTFMFIHLEQLSSTGYFERWLTPLVRPGIVSLGFLH